MSLFVRTLWLCGAVPMGEGGKVFQKSWFLNLTSPQTVGIVLSVSVIGAVVARFVHTEEVTGSNPVSRTKEPPFQGTGVLLCPPRRTLHKGSETPPTARSPRRGNANPDTAPPRTRYPRDITRTRNLHRLRTNVLPQARGRTARALHYHRHRPARHRPERLARIHGRQGRTRRPARLPRLRIPRPQVRHYPRRRQRLRTIPRRSRRPRRPCAQLRRKRRPARHGT